MTWNILLSREGVDLPTISGIDVVFYDHVWEFTKTKNEDFFSYFKAKHLTHYIAINSQELGSFLYKKYFNTPEQVKKHYSKGTKFLEQVKQTCELTKKTLTPQSEKEQFLKAFKEFRTQFMKINYIYSITSWLAIEAWQNDFEEILSQLMKKRKIEKQEEIIASIYTPWKKTAIYEIQEKLKQGVTAEQLVKEYQFLRSWVAVWHGTIDETWIKNLKQTSENNWKLLTAKQIEKILQPNEEEKHFLKMAPFIIFFKDWRDDLRRAFVYNWSFLFELLAKRFDTACNDFGYLTLDEIENCIKNGEINTKTIEKRKQNAFIVTVEGKELKIKVIDHEAPKKYRKVIEQIEKSQKTSLTIKGTAAYKGKIIGRVRIVRSYHDVKKVQEGEILVANTTHPDYLPAMQKAAAFVTNEGGMVSHAAIVARELKKPCIVGTRNATKLLKDDDLVEVDANEGIVKKIK